MKDTKSPQDLNPRAWKAETKICMSNERTLIAWLRTAATLAIAALFSAVGRQSKKTVHWNNVFFGIGQGAAAVVIAILATWLYWQRRRMLAARFHGSWGSRWPPALIGCCILVGLLADVSLMFQVAFGLPADEGLLPLPLSRNATPPFLYLTFHGTGHPGRPSPASEGVAGVHRFTLGGEYAGLAVDQAAAQMHHPRGIVEHLGLLFVAESWGTDPSLTVFGGCAGPASTRPFLGRIRPKLLDTELAASFAHPYGLAAAPSGDDALHVSTQDGAAVVSVDVSDSRMEVVHQVQKPRPDVMPHSEARAGPLRGLAIDSEGCEHVADHHAGVIWHYCSDADGARRRGAAGEGGDVWPAMSRVPRPTGLAVAVLGGSRLLVSSLGDPGLYVPPAVYVLDLKTTEADGSHPIVASFVHEQLTHPAGLLLHEHTLYVLDQYSNSLLTFDVHPDSLLGTYTGVLVGGLPDRPEAVLLTQDQESC